MESTLPDMDPDEFDRLWLLESNGFGLQVSESHYYLGVVYGVLDPSKEIETIVSKEPTDKEIEKLRIDSGSKTLESGDCLGKYFLKVHWTEKDLIPPILTGLIQMGYHFTLQCFYHPSFGPKHCDTEFAWSMVEPRIQDGVRELMKNFELDSDIFTWGSATKLFDVWNWTTPSGKSFCRWLTKKANRPAQDEANDKLNYLNWTYCPKKKRRMCL